MNAMLATIQGLQVALQAAQQQQQAAQQQASTPATTTLDTATSVIQSNIRHNAMALQVARSQTPVQVIDVNPADAASSAQRLGLWQNFVDTGDVPALSGVTTTDAPATLAPSVIPLLFLAARGNAAKRQTFLATLAETWACLGIDVPPQTRDASGPALEICVNGWLRQAGLSDTVMAATVHDLETTGALAPVDWTERHAVQSLAAKVAEVTAEKVRLITFGGAGADMRLQLQAQVALLGDPSDALAMDQVFDKASSIPAKLRASPAVRTKLDGLSKRASPPRFITLAGNTAAGGAAGEAALQLALGELQTPAAATLQRAAIVTHITDKAVNKQPALQKVRAFQLALCRRAKNWAAQNGYPTPNDPLLRELAMMHLGTAGLRAWLPQNHPLRSKVKNDADMPLDGILVCMMFMQQALSHMGWHGWQPLGEFTALTCVVNQLTCSVGAQPDHANILVLQHLRTLLVRLLTVEWPELTTDKWAASEVMQGMPFPSLATAYTLRGTIDNPRFADEFADLSMRFRVHVRTNSMSITGPVNDMAATHDTLTHPRSPPPGQTRDGMAKNERKRDQQLEELRTQVKKLKAQAGGGGGGDAGGGGAGRKTSGGIGTSPNGATITWNIFWAWWHEFCAANCWLQVRCATLGGCKSDACSFNHQSNTSTVALKALKAKNIKDCGLALDGGWVVPSDFSKDQPSGEQINPRAVNTGTAKKRKGVPRGRDTGTKAKFVKFKGKKRK